MICSVGDSRAYLVRDAGVLQITRITPSSQDPIERGVVVASEAQNHPFANVLSRNIGARSLPHPTCLRSSSSLASGCCCAATG